LKTKKAFHLKKETKDKAYVLPLYFMPLRHALIPDTIISSCFNGQFPAPPTTFSELLQGEFKSVS